MLHEYKCQIKILSGILAKRIKQHRPSMVAIFHDSSPKKVKAERQQVWGQSRLHAKILSQKKQKTKKHSTSDHQRKKFQILEHSGSGCSSTLYELSTTHRSYGVLQEAHRDAPGGDPCWKWGLKHVGHTCHPGTWEAEIEGPGQGHPWLHRGLEASLGYKKNEKHFHFLNAF